jgi:predicted Zn-ribbon and HTH transcriptional regulator
MTPTIVRPIPRGVDCADAAPGPPTARSINEYAGAVRGGRPPSDPPARSETVRESIRAALREATLTARELSERVRLSEREVAGHLEHLARARRDGERLVIDPARCLACGFTFTGRDRVTKPGRCPACRETRIAPPRFALSA